MGDMPYSIDKGQALTHVDEILNGAEDNELISFVRTWRDKANKRHQLVRIFTEQLVHPGLAYAPLGSAERPNREADFSHWYSANGLIGTDMPIDVHLSDHWFGETGFFVGLVGGLAEEIVGETICRAIEASLAIAIEGAPGDPLPVPVRRWSFDLWWACPAPRFDGHVTWRENGASGQVRVLFLTPGIEDGALFVLLTTDPTKLDPMNKVYGRYHLEEDEARGYASLPSMSAPPTYDSFVHDGLFSYHGCGSWIISARATVSALEDDGLLRLRRIFEPEEDPFPKVIQSGGVAVVSPAYASGGTKPH